MRTPTIMAQVYPMVPLDGKPKDGESDSGLDEANVDNTPGLVTYRSAEEDRLDTTSLRPDIELHQCARNGYTESAQLLLQDEVVRNNIDLNDDEHQTPLHYAARYNHFHIVQLLVEKGADVNAEDDEGLTPLHYACRIKRARRRSRKTKMKLIEDGMLDGTDSTPNSPSPSPGRKPQDPDASAIHYLIEHGASVTCVDEYRQTPLHHAALRGDEIACEQLLMYQTAEEPLVDTKDIQEMTPLHTAACQGEYEIARMLVKAGADVRSLDEELSTPLHEAATVGNTKIAKLIFNSCPDPNRLNDVLCDRDEDGNTPLMLAVESGRYMFVTLIMERGSSVNTKNKAHMTPLHLAAINGDVRIVRLLLERGSRIEALNHEHQTPLHKAALFNNVKCIEALLQSNAKIEAKDKDNFTPLLLSACYGHAPAVELLIKSGADVTVEDKNDRTAIYLSAEENHLDVLQVILKNTEVKTLINDRDQCNNGPLHIAASLGHIKIVKCLLDNGADMYCKNDLEQTAIHMASNNGYTTVVRELVNREKNSITDGDEDSNTALHLAAMNGHIKLVETLLNLGADVDVRNSILRTPLACAAAQGFVKTVRLLINADSSLDPQDKTKLTPLLVAAGNGHVEVVDFLLKRRADVKLCDPDGNNCLDLAIQNDHQDVALEIVKSESWKDALRNSVVVKGVIDTPLRKLIRKMPDVANEVFNRCIEESKPEEKKEGSQIISTKYEITFTYEFLDDLYNINRWQEMDRNVRKKKNGNTALVPYTDVSEIFKKNHPMMIMVTSSREELLAHPLVTALLRYKWTSFGRYFYYFNFLLYLIFLFFLTGYVSTTPPPYEIDKSNFGSVAGSSDCEKYYNQGNRQHTLANIGKYVVLVLAFTNILKEVFQAYHGKLYYLTWENLLEVVMFVSSILFTLDVEVCQRETGYRTDWQWNFGTIAIFLAWIELVLFIQKFPELGIYVVMFKDILNTFFRFFIVFVMFIIAFGMGFYCLIQNQTPYATVWNSIIRTTVMMIGEFDYNDIFHGGDDVHYWLTYVLFCTFVVIMSIIIMNLLVGLAVDDIKGVQEQAALKRIAMKVQLTLDVERIAPGFNSRFYRETETIVRHSAEEAQAETKPIEQFENQIQKSQQKVLKKIEKVKTGMKDVKADVARIEEMLEAIMKAQDITLHSDDI